MRRGLRFIAVSEKNRESNHLQMSLQRKHFLLIYLKTLSVGLAGILDPATWLPHSIAMLNQLRSDMTTGFLDFTIRNDMLAII